MGCGMCGTRTLFHTIVRLLPFITVVLQAVKIKNGYRPKRIFSRIGPLSLNTL